MAPPMKFTKSQAKRALREADCVADAAATLGVAPSRLYARMREWELPKPGHRFPYTRAEFLDIAKRNSNHLSSIVRELNSGRRTVQRMAKEYKVKLREGRRHPTASRHASRWFNAYRNDMTINDIADADQVSPSLVRRVLGDYAMSEYSYSALSMIKMHHAVNDSPDIEDDELIRFPGVAPHLVERFRRTYIGSDE